MMRATWSLEVMKVVDKAYNRKNKWLNEIKQELKASETQNAELAAQLQ